MELFAWTGGEEQEQEQALHPKDAGSRPSWGERRKTRSQHRTHTKKGGEQKREN
jgi:hypothetical protein